MEVVGLPELRRNLIRKLKSGEELFPGIVGYRDSVIPQIVNGILSKRLAMDLNVFKDGTWLQLVSDLYPIGQMWKDMHPLCRWGGDFTRPDSDHYSLTWGGVQ